MELTMTTNTRTCTDGSQTTNYAVNTQAYKCVWWLDNSSRDRGTRSPRAGGLFLHAPD